MIRMKVLRVADTSVEGVISGYFARPKKAAGKFFPIVSLKYTNLFIVYRKFCIITTAGVARWICRGYFFTSIDLLEAYFTILLQEREARYTWFRWRDMVCK